MHSNKIISGLFILLLAGCMISCNNKPVVEQKTSEEKQKVEKYYNADHTEVIKEIKYYKNGQKEVEGGYKNKQRDGLWTYWFENGKKWSEGTFNEGVEEGLRSVYYENGTKRHEGMYLHGKETGIWKFWDENGVLIKQIDYSKIK